MWLINKLEQDRWFNWQDRVFLKLVFQGRFFTGRLDSRARFLLTM